MEKHLLFVFASLFLVAGSVHAQSVPLKADIPFDFVVGNTIMHAGTYTIQPLSTHGSVVLLRRLDLSVLSAILRKIEPLRGACE